VGVGANGKHLNTQWGPERRADIRQTDITTTKIGERKSVGTVFFSFGGAIEFGA